MSLFPKADMGTARMDRRSLLRLAAAASTGWLWGCTGIVPEPPPVEPAVADQARSLLNLLEGRNQSLKSFKGTGRITVETPENRNVARIAWIGVAPDRLRASVLSLAGQPTTTVAGNGETFYAVSHTELRFYKTDAENPDLKRIVQVPIRLRDAIALLTGRVPVRPFHVAAARDAFSARLLELKDRRDRTVERVWFHADSLLPFRMDVPDRDGRLQYRAEMRDFRTVDGMYQVPFAITVSDADARFAIAIERYWSNRPVAPGTFVLTDPKRDV